MIKKIFSFISFLLLTGCFTSPKYYPSIENIDLARMYGIEDAEAIYENNTFKTSEKIPVKRTWSDKEIIIKKEGFEEYHLNLESRWTNELWAEECGVGCRKVSAANLFLPRNILSSIQTIPIMGIGLLYLPIGIFRDVYNIFIGAPSVVIINPWRKFEIEKEIFLKPTEKYKKECLKDKNSFISNQGCIDCDSAETVYASLEECSRCPYRSHTLGNSCFISTEKIKENKTYFKKQCHQKNMILSDYGCIPCEQKGKKLKYVSSEECNRCPMYSFDGKECVKDGATPCHNKGDDYFYTYDEQCVSCDSPGEYKSSRIECDRCSNRVSIWNGNCRLKK